MRDLPAPVYVSSVRAQGLRPRRGGTTLAMTTCSVLPSVPYDAVGPPNSIFLSRLNTQPTRCPVNASPLPSRTATHDSGPTWFATPWLGGTCTRETYRFVPAHRLVKILERPAGQQFAPFQRPPTALGPVANTDTKLLIYGYFKRAEFWHRTGAPVRAVPTAKVSLFSPYKVLTRKKVAGLLSPSRKPTRW